MKSWSSPLTLGLATSPALVSAVRLPVQRRSTAHSANISGFSPTPGLTLVSNGISHPSNIANSNNIFYSTNITMSGMQIPLQLDTGSSDVWISPDAYPGVFASAHNFTVPVGMTYGKGAVEGLLSVADIGFGGYNVKDQAFMSVTSTKDMDALFSRGAYGILPFGFEPGSNVSAAVLETYNATWGRTFMNNLFLQDPSTPNYVAFALERAGDLDDTAMGSLDIGEIRPEYAAIENSSSIPLWPKTADRWTVLLDALAVNGSNIPLKSVIQGASAPPAGKNLALLDTGTTFAFVPKWAMDAIYQSIQGSTYSESFGHWFMPCMAEGLISFMIGGTTIDVHPLDLSMPQIYTLNNGQNVTFCVNTIRTLDFDPDAFDFLLGDVFLRNVYAVYDYGDFDTNGNMGKPYVKLLPLTDPTTASASFKKSRAASLDQLPPEGSFTQLGLSTPKSPTAGSKLGNDPGSVKSSGNLASVSDDSDTSVGEMLKKASTYGPIVLALLGINSALLVGLVAIGAIILSKRGRGTTQSGTSARGVYAPVIKFTEDDDRSHTPVPQYT